MSYGALSSRFIDRVTFRAGRGRKEQCAILRTRVKRPPQKPFYSAVYEYSVCIPSNLRDLLGKQLPIPRALPFHRPSLWPMCARILSFCHCGGHACDIFLLGRVSDPLSCGAPSFGFFYPHMVGRGGKEVSTWVASRFPLQ